MIHEKITIKNRDKHDIIGILTLPNTKGSWPMIIGCHGLFTTKETFIEKWSTTLQMLHEEGYGSFMFDFTNNLGESFGQFENITVGQEVSDLEDVLSFFWTKQYVQKDRIGLLGHSLGGMVSLITAASSPTIAAQVVIAPVVNFQIVRLMQAGQEGVQAWKEKGYTIMHTRTLDRDFKIKYRFYEEGISYDMPQLAAEIKSPTLIIQGDQDDRVPVNQAYDLMKYLAAPKDLKIIDDGGHNLHTTDQQRQVANSTLLFLNKHLKGM